MPWIQSELLPSTLAPDRVGTLGRRRRRLVLGAAEGEEGRSPSPVGALPLDRSVVGCEPAAADPLEQLEQLGQLRPLWDRTASLGSQRPHTSAGLQALPSLAQRRLGQRLGHSLRPRTVAGLPHGTHLTALGRTRTLPDRLGETGEYAGEEAAEEDAGSAGIEWRDDARGHIRQLVHEGFLDICSKLTLEYEVESVDLSYERYKNSYEYDGKYKRVENSFRRGLEQASSALCLPAGDFSAADHAIPISKWCHFVCKRGNRRGAFEVNLIVQKASPAGQLEERRVEIYSRLKSGKYPNATSIMNFLASVLPRVCAANLTLEEAAEQAPAVDDAPRSCIDVIVTSQAKDRRRRAEEMNALKILELREEGRRQAALKRVISRMLNQAVFGAFQQWSDAVENSKAQLNEEKRRQQIMKRIVSKMFHRTLSAAFERWCRQVREQKAKQAEEERKQQLMKRILSKMFHKALSGAFERWCEEVEDRKAEEERKQALMKRIAMRMINKCLCTCLEAWAEHVREEVEKRARMKRVVSRMAGKGLSLAFERWCAYIDEIKQGEEEEKRKQDVLKRVVMRITHRALSTCLLLWAEHTIEEVEKRTRMRRILLRMTGDLLGRMFANWMEFIKHVREEADEEERRQGVVERVIKRMINRVLSTGFLVWYENVAEIKEERLQQAQEAVDAAKRALEAELDSTKKEATARTASLELELANARRALEEKESPGQESKACIIS